MHLVDRSLQNERMEITGAALSQPQLSAPPAWRAQSFAAPRTGLPEDLLAALSRTQAAMMGAVLNGAGLQRIVELAAAAVGGPVAAVVPRLGPAAAGGARGPAVDLASLETWLADRVARRCPVPPLDVVAEAPVDLRDELVGVVVLLRGLSSPREQSGEFLRLATAAVQTLLAIKDAKETLQQKLRGSFLEELRERDDLSAAEIVRRAGRLGCDLSQGALILCAELTVERPRHALAIIAAEHPGALAQIVEGAGRPRIYAALPAATGPESCRAVGTRLAMRLQPYGSVGTSSFRSDPADLRRAVREAELALEVAVHSGAQITDEIGNGTYKLLFRMLASNPREVHDFYEDTIATMVRYDEQNRTELTRTLHAYLGSNCNMNATALAVFAHRHTIASRLERIHDLTGLDPAVSDDREQLGLGLKAYRLLAPQLRGTGVRAAGPV
jgi:sugar diacid utilization regulator